MYNFKNVLITGGAGFIGSNLINRIADKHKFSKIVSIDNYSTGDFKNHIRRKNIEYINLDCQKISIGRPSKHKKEKFSCKITPDTPRKGMVIYFHFHTFPGAQSRSRVPHRRCAFFYRDFNSK